MSDLTQLDFYLSEDGPAALVIREYLMSADGPDGILFPPTFAAVGDFPGGYNIDSWGGEANVCLIDSVGSQANRLEPIFMEESYRHLVPQILIQVSEEVSKNLLEVGHRAGDALVRCSALQKELQEAFRQSQRGNAEPLAKIAPTSLVFGVWDSRDTQEKRPRLINSTIRAFNVNRLTRSSVYIPPVDYTELGIISEKDKAKAESNAKSPVAQRGFVHYPASGTHGGVIATGGIRRDVFLSLAALRLLRAGNDPEKTLRLQRYILGLALVVFTHPIPSYLRQGCILVADPSKPKESWEVYPSGDRRPFTLTHREALEYATLAAQAFGVGPNRSVPFDRKLAQKEVAEAKKKAKKTSADQLASEGE